MQIVESILEVLSKDTISPNKSFCPKEIFRQEVIGGSKGIYRKQTNNFLESSWIKIITSIFLQKKHFLESLLLTFIVIIIIGVIIIIMALGYNLGPRYTNLPLSCTPTTFLSLVIQYFIPLWNWRAFSVITSNIWTVMHTWHGMHTSINALRLYWILIITVNRHPA